MPWSNATPQGVRERYRIITPNQVPANTALDMAITDAEAMLQPIIEQKFGTGASASATVAALVMRFAASLCYVWANGAGASQFRDDEWRFIADYLDGINSLPGVTTTTGVTNADETSPVFSLGEPETWPMPTNTIETDAEERRTF